MYNLKKSHDAYKGVSSQYVPIIDPWKFSRFKY